MSKIATSCVPKLRRPRPCSSRSRPLRGTRPRPPCRRGCERCAGGGHSPQVHVHVADDRLREVITVQIDDVVAAEAVVGVEDPRRAPIGATEDVVPLVQEISILLVVAQDHVRTAVRVEVAGRGVVGRAGVAPEGAEEALVVGVVVGDRRARQSARLPEPETEMTSWTPSPFMSSMTAEVPKEEPRIAGVIRAPVREEAGPVVDQQAVVEVHLGLLLVVGEVDVREAVPRHVAHRDAAFG